MGDLTVFLAVVVVGILGIAVVAVVMKKEKENKELQMQGAKKFKKIKIGMTYEAAADLMGSGGQLVSETLTQRKFICYFGRYTKETVSGEVITNVYDPQSNGFSLGYGGLSGETRAPASVTVVFEDDKVISKSQNGLNL